jgi:toxin-antitoxin system PIN domain toxin
LADAGYLFDLNLLMALTDEEHQHHTRVQRWFDGGGCRCWGTCALTQAGFIRLVVNPKGRGLSVPNAQELLTLLTAHPGHSVWPIADGWASTTSPFTERIFGHLQVTDAYLLGLAVQHNGVLATMDRAIRHLAGPRYSGNLLVLEP